MSDQHSTHSRSLRWIDLTHTHTQPPADADAAAAPPEKSYLKKNKRFVFIFSSQSSAFHSPSHGYVHTHTETIFTYENISTRPWSISGSFLTLCLATVKYSVVWWLVSMMRRAKANSQLWSIWFKMYGPYCLLVLVKVGQLFSRSGNANVAVMIVYSTERDPS